ncbi:purple acid phosphatase 20 [Pyrus ussuriensis x Pyrus communis]|uniref:Purple acid phosphatase n=1 Tax=Pyrus ussuriensis x Pyrus communis TaxID=2448454 RepID=A0A5N5G2Z2_9ROSA|nr:purple acid phosphatase 20 [Pyrus ussuriensis x Pyrus communis]
MADVQRWPGLVLAVFTLIGLAFPVLFGAFVQGYNRPPPRKNLSVPADDPGSASPIQVHTSVVGEDRMRVAWITDIPSPATVVYGTFPGCSYTYGIIYTYGDIHDVVIGPLKPNMQYYYRCGSSHSDPEFSFKTPPAAFPITFAVLGDIGQTEWTSSTLQHIAKTNHDMLLLPGDLSYADLCQSKWDSFGRLVQPLASQRPWMVTQGNHEVKMIPIFHPHAFTAYNARWHMPYEESGSDSNLYYSFNVAGVRVIMLGSYTDFDPSSAQYQWGRTPWIIVLIHAPWHNSNKAHQGESESVGMKEAMEDLLYQARVDVVYAGHVHAYERFVSFFLHFAYYHWRWWQP